jgi:hypothetical protein
MNPQVTVFGWYSSQNLGDEAYKYAFPLIFPNVDFEFVPELIPGQHYEHIILGGGDVFNRFYINQLKTVTGHKYAMSVNCTDLSFVNQHIAEFDKVFFRGSNACNQAMIFPDFTFILEPNPLRGKELIDRQFRETGSDRYARIVVVVINGFLMTKEDSLVRDYLTFEKVSFDLANIFDNTNASFLFLPFGTGWPHNDIISNGEVYARCKFWKKNSLWHKNMSVQDALDICAAANATISSRLHGCIFSTVGGTPFIDLTHHSKTKNFLEFIGRPHWSMNYWKFSNERTQKMLNNILDDGDGERSMLKNQAGRYRDRLKTVQNFVDFSAKLCLQSV